MCWDHGWRDPHPGHAADSAPGKLAAVGWLYSSSGFKSFLSLSPSGLRAQILTGIPLNSFPIPLACSFKFWDCKAVESFWINPSWGWC